MWVLNIDEFKIYNYTRNVFFFFLLLDPEDKYIKMVNVKLVYVCSKISTRVKPRKGLGFFFFFVTNRYSGAY